MVPTLPWDTWFSCLPEQDCSDHLGMVHYGRLGMLVTLMGSSLMSFVATCNSQHWSIAMSIMLFISTNQYFSLNICLVFVFPQCPRLCPRLCPSLTTFLCRADGNTIRCPLKRSLFITDSS